MQKQIYPSVPLSVKEVRLLLRRINKSLRILDSDLSGPQNQLQLDDESLNSLSDLIYSKAVGKVYPVSPKIVDDDPSNIINELI